MGILASAEQTDLSGGQWGFILFCAGVIVVVGIMGFVPIRMARVRGSRWAEVIVAGVVFWGCLMGGSAIYAEMENQQYQSERDVQIRSGYFDPAEGSKAPGWPWALWGGLIVGYGGLLAGATRGGQGDKVTR